jgi:hypothetical protein
LGKHSIAPESSDGFASVGTILPKEKAALLPGGFFVAAQACFRDAIRDQGNAQTHFYVPIQLKNKGGLPTYAMTAEPRHFTNFYKN